MSPCLVSYARIGSQIELAPTQVRNKQEIKDMQLMIDKLHPNPNPLPSTRT